MGSFVNVIETSGREIIEIHSGSRDKAEPKPAPTIPNKPAQIKNPNPKP